MAANKTNPAVFPRHRSIAQAIHDGCKQRREIEAVTGYKATEVTSSLAYLQRKKVIRLLHRNTRKGAGVYAMEMAIEKAMEQLRAPDEKIMDIAALMRVWPIGQPLKRKGRVVRPLGEYEPGPVPKVKREVRA